MTALPKTVAFRAEHTGSAAADRAQRLAQQVVQAHEQTKAYVTAQAATLASLMMVAVIPMGDANQVVSAAQMARGVIRATGACTASRTLSGFTRPTSTDGSDHYWRFVWNNTTGGFSLLVSDGVTPLSLGPSAQSVVLFTNAGPVVLR